MGASMSMQDIHGKVNEAAVGVGVDDDVDVELVEVDVAVPLPSKWNGSKGLCSHFSERITRTYCWAYAFRLGIHVRITHGRIVAKCNNPFHGAA
jgi:hypothetical protein